MEKLTFKLEDTQETAQFYVLEQTRMAGVSYILVTDSEAGDAECLILKDMSKAEDAESVYEIVTDDDELLAVSKVFEELIEDIDIEM